MKTIALVLLAAMACMLYAQQNLPPAFGSENEIELQMYLPEGPLPSDSLVFARYEGTNGKRYGAILVPKADGIAALYAYSPPKNLELTFDDPATPSVDGQWSGELAGGVRQGIAVVPIGDLTGTFLDEQGAAVVGADVALACPNGYSATTVSGNAGEFLFSRATAGECTISASAEGKTASEKATITRGQIKGVTLRVKEDYLAYAAGGLLLLVLLAVGAATIFYGKKGGDEGKGSRKGSPGAKPQNLPTQRQADLLSTLDGKERNIVMYVMHHAPSAVKIGKVRKELLMPKTSLTRSLQALERKQFLKIEKIGFRQYAKLHDFFRER